MITGEVFMDIKAMYRNGLSIRKIARITGLHRLTVKRHVELAQARAAPPADRDGQTRPNPPPGSEGQNRPNPPTGISGPSSGCEPEAGRSSAIV